MHICLVGHGNMEIPPKGWGAVETIIWNYAEEFRKLGVDVEIVNVNANRAAQEVHSRYQQKRKPFDWVWVHNERAVRNLMWLSKLDGFKVVATGHMPYNVLGPQHDVIRKHLARVARANYVFALTPAQSFAVTNLNESARAAIQPNGAEVSAFRFAEKGNGRCICVGRIEPRKGQERLATFTTGLGMGIDFVGPSSGSFEPDGANRYLGQWTREELRDRLTDYSVLALYTSAEAAQPLVVVEAMAAGLSVVTTSAASHNLELGRGFISIEDDLVKFGQVIRRELESGDRYRLEARRYAEENFDWPILAHRALTQLEAWSNQ